MTEASPRINMTPLIDVVLVLLIVFMAVSPPPVHELEVQLVASSRSDVPPERANEQLVLTIEQGDVLRLADETVPAAELGNRLRAALSRRDPQDRALFVLAADGVGYATLVGAIESAQAAGATAIGIAADAVP